MEHYVTLFDSLFLPQGLALHASMEQHAGPYTLWILCVDEESHDVLSRLKPPNVKLLRLSAVETPALLEVKKARSQVEYCWTLTPFTPKFVFDRDPHVQRVTYVDADLWFRRNPMDMFRELEQSGKQVLITDHAYAPEHDQSATSGRFCVQFVTFTRNGGELVRKWWEDRCIEWCYARQENGKFGDQKYLDDWPERFAEQVHVLQHTELTRAPWNGAEAPDEEPAFFHFHGLRLLEGDGVNTGGYPLSQALLRRYYSPYLGFLGEAIDALRNIGFEPRPQQHRGIALRLKSALFRSLPQRRRFVLMPIGDNRPVHRSRSTHRRGKSGSTARRA